MQKQRLEKLANFLRTIPRKKFDIGRWQNDCGTVACAFGWCPTIFPRSNLKYEREAMRYTHEGQEYYGIYAAEKFFNIPIWVARSLFFGDYYPEFDYDPSKPNKNFGNAAITPKRVARRIEHYIKTGEIK